MMERDPEFTKALQMRVASELRNFDWFIRLSTEERDKAVNKGCRALFAEMDSMKQGGMLHIADFLSKWSRA